MSNEYTAGANILAWVAEHGGKVSAENAGLLTDVASALKSGRGKRIAEGYFSLELKKRLADDLEKMESKIAAALKTALKLAGIALP